MQLINIHAAKTRLSELISAIEDQGEEFTICRNGKPVARLVPIQAKVSRLFSHDPMLRVVLRGEAENPLSPADWPREAS